MLLIGKDLEIVPKMIFPVEQIEEAWLRPEEAGHLQNMRPPTPPREEDEDNQEGGGNNDNTQLHPQQPSLLPPQQAVEGSGQKEEAGDCHGEGAGEEQREMGSDCNQTVHAAPEQGGYALVELFAS